MRVLHGNGPPADSSCTLTCWNSNGLRDVHFAFLLDVLHDAAVVVETHLTPHLQHALAVANQHLHFAWSPAPQGRAGVAIVARKQRFWSFSILHFDHQSACAKLRDQGRLLAVQLHRGTGTSPMILYGFYGWADARHNPATKRKLTKALQDIASDIASRGNIPTFLMGDLNMQHHELPILTAWHTSGALTDVGASYPQPTFHRGQGTRIDYCLANPPARQLVAQYSVNAGYNPTEHSVVQIGLRCPLRAQHRYMRIGVANLPDIRTEVIPNLLPVSNSTIVSEHLRVHNVDQAFTAWTTRAEQVLTQIVRIAYPESAWLDDIHKHGRGQVKWRRQAVWPKACSCSAVTLHAAQLARALQRLQALEHQCLSGIRATKTWSNLHQVVPSLRPPLQAQVQSILDGQLNIQNIATLKGLIHEELLRQTH